MPVYLSQHGKSASKEVDPRRGLTDEGREEVTRVASALARARVPVDIIHHSGKARAAESAEIYAAHLDPRDGVQPCEGMDPLDDVVAFAGKLARDGDTMYVGHLPFMERLVSCLVTGDPDGCVVRFVNGGVVCMEWDAEKERWVVGWTVSPGFQGD